MTVRPLQFQEVSQQLFAVRGQDRFGMKLHAFHFHLTMTQTHDDVVGRKRRDLETSRQRLFLNDERMVSSGKKVVIQSGEDRLAIMTNFRSFTVHQFRCTNYFSAERLSDSLMAQAH